MIRTAEHWQGQKGVKRVVKIVLTWCNFVVRRALTTHAFSRSQTRIAKQPKSSKVHLLLLSCWSKFWNPLINHFWQVNKKGFMTVLPGLKNKDRVGKNLGKHLWQTEISGQLFDLTGQHNRKRANRNDPLSYFWWWSIAKFHFWGLLLQLFLAGYSESDQSSFDLASSSTYCSA